jgi:hypothetical protein
MSGTSGDIECPNCGKAADLYTDRKPYDYSCIWCPYCGLSIHPQIEYMTLEELNEIRKERGLRKLSKLPNQSFEG